MDDKQIVVNRIPQPEEIRRRLCDSLREAKILRQLLKVSERAAKDREIRQEAQHAR